MTHDHQLILASTPLHAFFALGLMQGPWRGAAHTLALIDQRIEQRDFIAEALHAHASFGAEVLRFAKLGVVPSPRRLLGEISALAARLQPTTIAVGNDHRIEFYAARRGAPAARCIYIDDGLYSYLPHKDAKPAWRETLSDWRRGLKYGVRLERPARVGGSRAVDDAYVLLPGEVHERLAAKPVRGIEPSWFTTPEVRGVCTAAAALAGIDAAGVARLALLVLLPHPRFLDTYPTLKRRIERLIEERAARGDAIAVKAHPIAAATPLDEQLALRLTRRDAVVALPANLPVEVLLPLLARGTQVVGALSTALLTLARLGTGLAVRSLEPPEATPGADRRFNERAFAIYRSVGIVPLGAASAPTADECRD